MAHGSPCDGTAGPIQRLFRLDRPSSVGGLVNRLTRSNRRGTDPYARWCGRGGAARLPPIPINNPRETGSRSRRQSGSPNVSSSQSRLSPSLVNGGILERATSLFEYDGHSVEEKRTSIARRSSRPRQDRSTASAHRTMRECRGRQVVIMS